MGYQFSWFSWRVQSSNSSSHEMEIFCINYERKYYGYEILNPTNVSFLCNPRKLVPTKIKPSTSGLKLPQKSREKSLLPPAGLGRSEILAGRSEILTVAETRRELPCKLLLYCLYLSPIYLFPSYLYTILCHF